MVFKKAVSLYGTGLANFTITRTGLVCGVVLGVAATGSGVAMWGVETMVELQAPSAVAWNNNTAIFSQGLPGEMHLSMVNDFGNDCFDERNEKCCMEPPSLFQV